MERVYIKHNPYTVETVFKINDKVVSKNSTLGAKSNKRLQYWLEKNNSNWDGIVSELVKACNDNKLEVTFEGRKIDFEDLKLTFEKSKTEVEAELIHKEIKNDSDILKEIGELIELFNNGPIEELKSKYIRDTYNNAKSSKFKVNVIATMSSGKSTLINALLGQEIMPSKNEACTATIGRITNNDSESFTAECKDENENIVYERSTITLEDMQRYNEDPKVTYIDIEGAIPYISSEKMNLLLVDTPGPNNSISEYHSNLTENIINDKEKGVVLYVINATQFGINDDKILLEMIANEMKRGGKQSKDRFIFAVNKCDEFDIEKGESIETLLKNVEKYLLDKGIEEPNIFPISAQVAKLIRMYKNGLDLTKKEKRNLENICDDFIEIPEYHFEKMASLSESCRIKVNNRLNEAKKEQDYLEEALIHTGIPAIEEAISEYLDKYAYPIKINDAIGGLKSIIEENIMKQKLDSEISKDIKVYDSVRNQILESKKKMRESKKADLFKEKIDQYDVDRNKFKEAVTEIENSVREIIERYTSLEKIERSKAYFTLQQFTSDIARINEELEAKLNMTIKNSVIDEGEKLIYEYENYLRVMESDVQIEGFTFSKMTSIQSIQINDIYDLMENYQDVEEQYTEKAYKNSSKKWYKPWTWGEESYYTEEVKVGEIDYIDIRSLVQDCTEKIYKNIDYNIFASFELAKSEVIRLKKYFNSELEKLDRVMGNIIEELDRSTSDEQVIKERVQKNTDLKRWSIDVAKKLESIINA